MFQEADLDNSGTLDLEEASSFVGAWTFLFILMFSFALCSKCSVLENGEDP